MPVAIDNRRNEGNNASPAPFYMSTNGYGVVRNTWTPGSYAFGSTVQTTHNVTAIDGNPGTIWHTALSAGRPVEIAVLAGKGRYIGLFLPKWRS